jgi:hypothetical protein
MKMNKLLINFGIILTFVFVGAIASAQAQTKNIVIADIPFDFYIKNQKLTAGEYEIKKLYLGGNQTTLVFQPKGGKTSTIVTMLPLLANREMSENQPRLIFNRYGSDYFLTKVLNPAENFGAQLPKTKGEIKLAKNIVETKQETVPMKESGQ